jgi:starch phosphorylase
MADSEAGMDPEQPRVIAYFTMEAALESDMPTYSGGLGVLAGDTLRSAADLGLPMVGVSLIHRRGYFRQEIEESGWQREEPAAWSPEDKLVRLDATASVEIEGRRVVVQAWRYDLQGISGSVVPVFLLDTDLPQNDARDRRLTDHLYGGDERYRLSQEVVLGIGGVRLLRALGFRQVARFHMNEGHSALLALELFAEHLQRRPGERAVAAEHVKRRCVFTTHTPVPAGHDQFPRELVENVLGRSALDALDALECCNSVLNMTLVALMLSRYINGVTKRHGEVSRSLFPGYPIGSITNGVHSVTWTSPAFRELYDRHIPDWRRDGFSLRYAIHLPLEAVRAAHGASKKRLVEDVNRLAAAGFDEQTLTLGFARRSTAYKRPLLIFHDPERLRRIAGSAGLQIVLGGKAHPRDHEGKLLIQSIWNQRRGLRPQVRVAYLPDYGLELGKLLVAGSDVWVNTPKPPYEASGTSGMKAAHNGVPSLSVLDGWWTEGYEAGITGWAIGGGSGKPPHEASDAEDAASLYAILEREILPLYSGPPEGWARLMRSTIGFNASFFNTHRMLHEYTVRAYQDSAEPAR